MGMGIFVLSVKIMNENELDENWEFYRAEISFLWLETFTYKE